MTSFSFWAFFIFCYLQAFGDRAQEEIEITRRAEETRLSMGEGAGARAVDASLGSAFHEDGQGGVWALSGGGRVCLYHAWP